MFITDSVLSTQTRTAVSTHGETSIQQGVPLSLFVTFRVMLKCDLSGKRPVETQIRIKKTPTIVYFVVQTSSDSQVSIKNPIYS